MKVLVAQSCPTPCDPMGFSLPGFSVQGILQARILGWVAISFSRGSSWPRDRNQVCIAGRIFTVWATNYHTIVLISHSSKVMLKILQAEIQQYMDQELPSVQGGCLRGRWTRDQIANIHWIMEKARGFQKNIYFCFTDYTKAFVWITKTGKFLKRWEYQINLPVSWETCVQVNKQHLEPDVEQWTGLKSGKERVKAVYCHPAYVTYMQSASCEMLGWRKHKLESRLLGEISTTSDMQMITLME